MSFVLVVLTWVGRWSQSMRLELSRQYLTCRTRRPHGSHDFCQFKLIARLLLQTLALLTGLALYTHCLTAPSLRSAASTAQVLFSQYIARAATCNQPLRCEHSLRSLLELSTLPLLRQLSCTLG
ncbi:hypothetical protein HaLaN_16569 [Haematococcus lacustris]|uniref:Uncharacterized protein n=1 Tax=Haematococcus lacustris TaxID=44745 RepID=A0A699ZBW9_HAELA|nr:hypothetical protein HaLaN_16569 [Haematococcus lacustris]